MRQVFFVLFFAVSILAAPVPDAAPQKTKFIVLEKDALKTATVTYEKGDVTVDLIGVVHIGEKAYYSALNKQFANYDALLYEMVGPKNVRPQKGADMVGMIAKIMLELDSQKARIDYNKPNFVHADLSLEELGDEMKKRGETTFTFGLRVLADVLSQKPRDPAELLDFALADTPAKMKRIFAKQLSGQTSILPALDQVLVGDRNKAAMKVFADEVKAGKKKLGIFYGAAHMPDFEERLLKDGFKRKGVVWLTAWDLED